MKTKPPIAAPYKRLCGLVSSPSPQSPPLKGGEVNDTAIVPKIDSPTREGELKGMVTVPSPDSPPREGEAGSSSITLSLEGRGQGEGENSNGPNTGAKQQNLTHLAKDLRKRSTDIEWLIWSHLRAGRCEGMKFRRQHPIGQYIVDFVCLEKRLIIELDGGHHALPAEALKDRQRDAWLQKEGYTVLHFWDNEVLMNMNGVLEVIRKGLINSPSP